MGSGPYALTGRYESLAGPVETRRVRYLMRRWLGLSVQQAQDLPWWEHQLLHEQLLEDKPWITYVVAVEMPEDDSVGTAVGGDAESLRGLGFTAREAGTL